MKSCLRFLCILAVLPLGAQTPAAPAVKRIVLYKNGIGYFEHAARVSGSQSITLSFNSGQLDDVLKSLTVLDLNGGRIGGVTYNSESPVERQFAELRLPVAEKPTLTEFLGALRGARLEVRSGTTVTTGRLLSMERKTRISGGTTLEVDYLSMITDGGEVRTAELSPAFSVKLLDPSLAEKVGRFLDLSAATREPDLRKLTVAANGTGERSLFLSYVSEVPVWKSTYRLILPTKANPQPLLQGWAIVDNPTAQDWEKVEVSLVAGAPQAFIQHLSQPLYGRRPVVPVTEAVMLSPQTFQTALSSGPVRLSGTVTDPSGAGVPGATVAARDGSGSILATAVTNANGRYEFASLPDGAIVLSAESRGFKRAVGTEVLTASSRARHDFQLSLGESAESVTVSAGAPALQTSSESASSRSVGSGRSMGSMPEGAGMMKKAPIPPPPPPAPSPVYAARAGLEAMAQAQALGDMFEYRIKEPLTLRRNQSALVPIVNTPVGAEAVSLWTPQNSSGRPLRAIWLHNNTGLTLDGGSFGVLENETFAGEGIFEPIRPNEKRLISYAADLDLTTSTAFGSESQKVSLVTVIRGALTIHQQAVEKKTYTVRNAASNTRTVLIEHAARPGYTLRAPAQVEETTPSYYRFRLPVPGGQTAALVVEEVKPLTQIVSLSTIETERVNGFVKSGLLSPDLEKALRKIIADHAAVRELDKQKNDLDERRGEIYDDQQRLRENLKSLKSSPEEKALLQRYTRQLDSQETELEKLKTQIADLDAKYRAAQSALEDYIQSLTFEVKL